MTSPSPPACRASTAWVIAPREIGTRSTWRMPIGRTEETLTRFCSPMPACNSARSNAFSSLVLLIPFPLVTKNREGTGTRVSAAGSARRGTPGGEVGWPLKFGPPGECSDHDRVPTTHRGLGFAAHAQELGDETVGETQARFLEEGPERREPGTVGVLVELDRQQMGGRVRDLRAGLRREDDQFGPFPSDDVPGLDRGVT